MKNMAHRDYFGGRQGVLKEISGKKTEPIAQPVVLYVLREDWLNYGQVEVEAAQVKVRQTELN